MELTTNDTLDLSKRGLKKIEKALPEDSKNINNLILDQNELQRLDNLDTYNRVEKLSICNNFLLRMYGVSRLNNLRELALNNNGILQIEGLKDLLFLRILRLAGNNIKSIEHLNNNVHLEELDLSNNQISFISDISYLKNLKILNLERNRIVDLRQCDRYLPTNIAQLGLAYNKIVDLNDISHLVHLNKLDGFTVQGNPCVAMAVKDHLGFDYRPFILNWILSVKSIDGFVVSAIESLKAEWLYSQGKGRYYQSGQHEELCKYLAETCPLTADALETEDQRKLRLILSKAQQHQQQLKEHTNASPIRSKLQSPRMQSRLSGRSVGKSPDRMSASLHCGSPRAVPQTQPESKIMSQSFDSPGLIAAIQDKDKETPNKPMNQSLEAASKMVPVPESLMSPDYQDPMFDIQRSIQRTSTSSVSSNNSMSDEKNKSKNIRNSPILNKSGSASPRLRPKTEIRRNSASKIESKNSPKKDINGKLNGTIEKNTQEEKKDLEKLEVNQKRIKKNAESIAAVTIQKMWRGYRSRNLNKDTLRILNAIQTARSKQHIERLTNDMEATKAALDSERKIQQLQMQAINALWKKVSMLQIEKHKPSCDENLAVLRQLTDTCCSLQCQLSELKDTVRLVLTAVTEKQGQAVTAAQTDAVIVHSPQEERCSCLKRPQSLPLSVPAAPSTVPPTAVIKELVTPSIVSDEERAQTLSTSAVERQQQLSDKNNPTDIQENQSSDTKQDTTGVQEDIQSATENTNSTGANETEICENKSVSETATVTENVDTGSVSKDVEENIELRVES